MYRWLIIVCCCTSTLQAQFILNGEATSIGDNCYSLTEAVAWQAGSMWYDSLISLENDFTVDFNFYLGDSDGGADGMAFVLQPVSTGLGSSGGGLGYEGIDPSVNIEFDSYDNDVNDDPPFDHVSIMRDGTLSHALPSALTPYQYIIEGVDNVEDASYHYGKIVWDAAAQTLSVYVDCDLRTSYTGDIVEDIFDGNPLVYMGFTAATGSLFNNQQVCFNYVSAVDALDDVAICVGDTISLVVPDGFASYSWSPDYNISNTTIPNPEVWPDITTTYIVGLADECGYTIYDTVVVAIAESPLLLGADTIVCEGYILTATAGYTTYSWSTGDSGPSIDITAPGSYWVSASGGGFCPAADTIQIIDVAEQPVLNFAESAGFCAGEGIVLDAGNGYSSYSWNTGAASQSISVAAAGLYICTVTNAEGCAATDSVLIEVYPTPDANLGFPTRYLCFGETELLNVYNEGATYLWQDGSTTPNYLLDTAGLFSVIVTSDNGCIAEDQVVVISDCLNDMYFPNVFTPNGDGNNDWFRPVLFADIENFYMEVWNRWGTVVYSGNDTNTGWDGYYAGVAQEMGTYLYTARFQSGGREHQLSGTVLLMR